MWPAGFRSTVNVAFVLPDKSLSVELWTLPEVSLREEVVVLSDPIMDDGVSNVVPTDAALVAGEGPSVAKFWSLTAKDEVDSVFCFTEVEVGVFKGLPCSTIEDASPLSFCEYLTEAALTLAGCPSALGCRISKSFNDSITASMNI
jgi:hypothetical protein